MGGYFGGLQPPLRFSVSPPASSSPAAAAAAAPRPSSDLPPKATAERSGGRHSRSLPGSSCQVPARPSRAAAAAERRRGERSGPARRCQAAGQGWRRGGGQGRGEVLSPARRPGRAPAVAPRRAAPGPRSGQRRHSAPGPLQCRGKLRCPAGAERRISTFWRRRGGGEGGLQWPYRARLGSDLISLAVLCYLLPSFVHPAAKQWCRAQGQNWVQFWKTKFGFNSA